MRGSDTAVQGTPAIEGGSRWLVAVLTVLAVLLTATSAAVAAPTSGGPPAMATSCAGGNAAAAATQIIGEHAVLDHHATISGLDVAVALDGRIAPGFQQPLLSVGGRWCSVEAFNAAAAEQLSGADAATLASAFAAVAAMPYLGEVAVTDVVTAGRTVRLTTTGGRHGAVSAWTIVVDTAGVRSATFTTTRWTAGDGSAGALEGLTSLPGHSRSFTRTSDGRVEIDATIDDLLAQSLREREAAVARAAAAAGLAPGDDLAHTFEDGLTIKVSYGLAPYTPDAGMDTGVKQADRLRRILAGAVVSYEDFQRWGVRDPFGNTSRTLLGQRTTVPDEAGYINVDSPLAPVCLACAVLTDAVEVHVALLFPEIAPMVVDIEYPDSEQFLNGVIGHELVHSLQGGYSDAAGAVFGSAFIEGVARATESLHDDASHTHQPRSIAYIDNANGCEGFENGRGGWINAQAGGPFNGHTYDACYFWWTYFAQHGPEGLTALLEAMPQALASSEGSAAARNLRLLDVASPDRDGTLDLVRWAAAAATGSDADGFTIPAGQTGDRLDWFALLSAAPRSAALASSQEVTLANGGVLAFHAQAAGTIAALPADAEAYLVDVVDRRFSISRAGVGSAVAAEQILVLVAPAAEMAAGELAIR